MVAASKGSVPWSPVFNTFSPRYNCAFAFGAVYESLFAVNPKTGELSPWLATGYSWAKGEWQLGLTARIRRRARPVGRMLAARPLDILRWQDSQREGECQPDRTTASADTKE